MLSSLTPVLAHGASTGPAWVAWLPHVTALVLAVGVSIAADSLFKTRTFGADYVRRFFTLGVLVAVASALGLGVFYAVNRFLVH